jgi:hypothetical protein
LPNDLGLKKLAVKAQKLTHSRIDHSTMSTLDLVFDGKSYAVPKKSVRRLIRHRNVAEAATYAVQTSVPRDVFRAFVRSLKTESEVQVTKGNAVSLWLLANEFFLSDLADECARFSAPVDQFASLCERVSTLERQLSVPSLLHKIDDAIETHEEELESLRVALESLRAAVGGEIDLLKSGIERPAPKLSAATESPCNSDSNDSEGFPLRKAPRKTKSLSDSDTADESISSQDEVPVSRSTLGKPTAVELRSQDGPKPWSKDKPLEGITVRSRGARAQGRERGPRPTDRHPAGARAGVIRPDPGLGRRYFSD